MNDRSKFALLSATLLIVASCARPAPGIDSAGSEGGYSHPAYLTGSVVSPVQSDITPSSSAEPSVTPATVYRSEDQIPTGSASTSVPAQVGQPPTKDELSTARLWANRAAIANGDRDATAGVAVLSTRRVAVDYIFGGKDIVPLDSPVIVVALHGNFNLDAFGEPPGVHVNDGVVVDELILVFDLATGSADVTTRNLAAGDKETDLSALGPVAELPTA